MSESLTIRILGDASHVEREIDQVARRVSDLQSRFAELGEAGRGVSSLGGAIASLAGPLRNVGTLVGRVTAQVRTLSQTPVVLNVAPAIASLARLSQMVQLVSAQIARMNALSFGGMSGMIPPPIRLAQGGLVRGPGGIDRVPALLTAGEFVLRKPAVERLGAAFLEALNRGPSQTAANSPSPQSPAPNSTASGPAQVNHFGGININVARGDDLHAIVRDLRLHGARLRNRRG
ncbi:MAG: hypothetical protein WD066_02035 [Planctomycetaceae bacterium]